MIFSFAATAAPVTDAGPPVVHRLSADQYRQIIADVFGPTIQLGGRFPPGVREEGLLEVGAGRASISASSLEQFERMAYAIAGQVVDAGHRRNLIPCQPRAASEPDDECATKFLAEAGKLLYRRPLASHEIGAQVQIAAQAASAVHDFYAGLETSLATMLVSPEFLFRKDVAVPDGSAAWRLDPYSKASRLSFLLWNSAPDRDLLAAAADGSLDTKSGLARQVDRMMSSSRITSGVRAFFADMLELDTFQTLAKDPLIYPKYTPDISRDATEQTLRTITNVLLSDDGDYRDLFTTRQTFVTPALASIYRIPVSDPDRSWQKYTFAQDDPRAGILSQISFTALHSHPGRSSPTIRGRALRQVFLCQKVPDPPGDVVFTLMQDTTNPQYRTARDRLRAHSAEPSCAGCHKMTDPLGLAMEQFDSSGALRTAENGAQIDVSGEMDGKPFNGVAGMSKSLREDPALPACLVRRVFSYGVGRAPSRGEMTYIQALTEDFADAGYRMKKLLRRLATDPAFYRVTLPPVESSADRWEKYVALSPGVVR